MLLESLIIIEDEYLLLHLLLVLNRLGVKVRAWHIPSVAVFSESLGQTVSKLQ